MDYKVVPDFLPKEDFDYLYNFIFSDHTPMRWRYHDAIAYKNDTTGFYFQNTPYPPSIDSKEEYLLPLLPLLYYGGLFKSEKILRVKYNLFVQQSEPVKSAPHYDFEFPHKVLLYSINSNNGYTILDPNGKNITVPSLSNQALFFNGSIEHQAITQTDEKIRANVNICYI